VPVAGPADRQYGEVDRGDPARKGRIHCGDALPPTLFIPNPVIRDRSMRLVPSMAVHMFRKGRTGGRSASVPSLSSGTRLGRSVIIVSLDARRRTVRGTPTASMPDQPNRGRRVPAR
jgi:hypothetical protein